MAGLVEVPGRMTVWGVVAATDLPAAEAHAEVHQRLPIFRHSSSRQWSGQLGGTDCVDMGALGLHVVRRLLRES